MAELNERHADLLAAVVKPIQDVLDELLHVLEVVAFYTSRVINHENDV